MSLIRSGSTLVPLLPSGSRYWPSPPRRRGPSSAPAAPACPAPAAGSGGSRRTSRRSATAGGSGRWRRCGSPGSRGRWISITMIALPGFSTVSPFRKATVSPGIDDTDRLDHADVGAGDPHLLALDHEAAVVEDGADPVAVGRTAAAGGQQDDHDRRRDQSRARVSPVGHGAGGASPGLHSEVSTLRAAAPRGWSRQARTGWRRRGSERLGSADSEGAYCSDLGIGAARSCRRRSGTRSAPAVAART